MVTLADVRAARETIQDAARQTPLMTATRLGERLGIHLALKVESFQKTGSFKARGALNRVRNTPPDDLRRGIISVSAGNHAQGVAWAAREAGAEATIVMPANASQSKLAATQGYGARVIQVNGPIGEAVARAFALQRERDLLLVHPFDDPLVIAGQGTVGLEILEQAPEVETLVCPIGGGGLISGVAVAARALKPGIRLIGVEPAGSAVMKKSWAAGGPATLERVETVADGLGAPMAGEHTYRLTREHVDDIVILTDDEIVAGMRDLMIFAKLYVEPAGAAATAALLAGKIPTRPGEHVVSIVSGGNMDLETLKALL